MNKTILPLFLLVPALLVAYTPGEKEESPNKKPPVQTEELLVPKGATSKGEKLISNIWHLVKHHKWHALKESMSSKYSCIGIIGNLSNRSEEIAFLKFLEIKDVEFDVVKVVKVSEDVLAVQYNLSIMSQEAVPDAFLPSARMSVFKKEHGTWLWKADADMSNFLIDTPTE